MANTRLTIVLRKDLQLSTGLAISQGIHCADGFMRDFIINTWKQNKIGQDKKSEIQLNNPVNYITDDLISWMEEPYLSVLAVECFDDLQILTKEVKQENFPFTLWEDTIPSPTFEGKAIRVQVGIAIGPADFDRIKIVTNQLKLY